MVAPISSMFREVKFEMIKVLLLFVILESSILFLASRLIFSIFTMPVWYSAAIAIVYFAVRFWFGLRAFDLKRIENRNPELREMLRTAHDNQSSDSLMAHALFSEVLAKVQRVSGGSILDLGRVLRRVFALFALSLILISIAFFNINISKFDNPLERPMAAVGKWFNDLTGNEAAADGAVDLGDEGLYGDPKMAELSEDQLNLQVNPALNDIDFSTVKDPVLDQESLDQFPGEATAVRDASYTGGLDDATERKTAAEYSQQVKQ